MALKLTDEEIWKWYQIILDQKTSSMSGVQYCKKNGIFYKTFSNTKHRMFSYKHSRPKEYEEYKEWSRLLSEGELQLTDFCRKHKIDRIKLIEMNTHLNYQEILERLKKEKGEMEEPQMSFVQVKAPQSFLTTQSPPIQEPELVEAQNDIEITITKGVKVMISPQVDSTKIIKIIQLLKDL